MFSTRLLVFLAVVIAILFSLGLYSESMAQTPPTWDNPVTTGNGYICVIGLDCAPIPQIVIPAWPSDILPFGNDMGLACVVDPTQAGCSGSY
jgi:hypothetical protein